MKDYTGDYGDIIDRPRHVSKNHPPMPLLDRAAQFAPFAALTGYGDAVEETARFVEEKPELDESRVSQLDAVLRELVPGDTVTVEYFLPDGKKPGGRLVTAAGRVKSVDRLGAALILEDGSVPFEDIYSLE